MNKPFWKLQIFSTLNSKKIRILLTLILNLQKKSVDIYHCPSKLNPYCELYRIKFHFHMMKKIHDESDLAHFYGICSPISRSAGTWNFHADSAAQISPASGLDG